MWFTTSSADPLKTSLFLRGIVGLLGTKVLTVLTTLCGIGISCTGLDFFQINGYLEAGVKLSEYALYALAGSWTLFGGFRKIYFARWAHPLA